MFVQPIYKTFTSLGRCVHSYSQVPGPKILPGLGNWPLFSPFGPYKLKEITNALVDLRSKYGKIFKLRLGVDMVVVSEPEGALKIFQYEGKYPVRPSFEMLKYYREKEFGCAGLVPDNGPNWYRLRQAVSPMLHLKMMHEYWKRQKIIAEDFVQYLESAAQDGVIDDFLKHAFLYSLESNFDNHIWSSDKGLPTGISVFCYGTRVGCFSTKNADCNRITQSNVEFLEVLGPSLFEMPLWKFVPTQVYKKLAETQNFMTEVTIQQLNIAKSEMASDRDQFAKREPFLYQLFNDSSITESERTVLVTEIFQGGIDATATTITMLLYYLSQNGDVQEKLYQKLLGSRLAPGVYPPLLRACLKETMRLFPTASANSRVIDSDAVICDYEIPKGTLVISLNPVMCREETYFPNSNDFIPSRWLRQKNEPINPYVSLPFGHGARMCPGRRLAEQEMMLAVAENFHIECLTEGEVRQVMKTNMVPDKALSFCIRRRNQEAQKMHIPGVKYNA